MGFGTIGHLVAHTRHKREYVTIGQLGRQFARRYQREMAFLAPMVGQVIGSIVHHTHPYWTELAGAPSGYAGRAAVLLTHNFRPICDAKWQIRY